MSSCAYECAFHYSTEGEYGLQYFEGDIANEQLHNMDIEDYVKQAAVYDEPIYYNSRGQVRFALENIS